MTDDDARLERLRAMAKERVKNLIEGKSVQPHVASTPVDRVREIGKASQDLPPSAANNSGPPTLPFYQEQGLDVGLLAEQLEDIKAGRDILVTSGEGFKAMISYAGQSGDRVAYDILYKMLQTRCPSVNHLIGLIAESRLNTTISPDVAGVLLLHAEARRNDAAAFILRSLLGERDAPIAKTVAPPPSSPKPDRSSICNLPPLETLLDQLDRLTGLAPVKREVSSLVNFMRVRALRQQQGLPVPEMSLHLVFTGNPGTGKTTVARLVSQIYAAIGVLRQGHLIEVDRSGLVAGYVGQTAIKTREVIDRALDGVLFVDEAYSLTEKGDQDFGNEAIETLLKAMEDHRQRLVVIAAGYTERMKGFIESNPGLKSRFSRVIEFPDYTTSELLSIADQMATQNGFFFTEEARATLGRILQIRRVSNEVNFGNARDVRNLFEAVIGAQANRIVTLDGANRTDLQTIIDEDVAFAHTRVQ